ncbi:histidine kinase N-terminal 7TM domain-containing protein [Natrinema salaciae]|uniref:histidine kinase n=1 Tax=Natrinema salaciae TaxID=1186196 RepID=A0A1H9FRM4_9EURY|nr:histidine kinase N-terminal 7TM domain-containing protein [Natrinema salaciae]SEQ40591.1 PAS domain S-box-containing protein [Natrinema salaciae]
MNLQYIPEVIPYIWILFLSTLIASGIATYTIVAKPDSLREPSVRAFVGLNVGSALWSGAYAIQVLSVSLQTKLAWFTVAWIGSVLVVVSIFSFAIAYTGYEKWLSRRTLLLVAIEPIFAFVLLVTRYQNLYTQSAETVSVSGLIVLDRSFGPIGLIHVLYLYSLLIVAAGFLLRMAYNSRRVYKVQAIAVLIAILVPIFANIVWFLELGPIEGIDFTPVAFVVSGLVYAVTVYRHHLLDIQPVARTAVVENMRDGFLVIDDTDRIRDANEAVRKMVSRDGPRSVIGRNVTTVLPDVASIIRADSSTDHNEISVDSGDGRRLFDVQVQPLSGEGHFRLLLLRDVTSQHAVEQRYQAYIENASDLITMVDRNGIVHYQSPSVSTVLGYDQSDLTGQFYLEYVHPEDRTRIKDVFRESLTQQDSIRREEYRLRDADGAWREVETIGRNLLGEPFVDGFVLNTRDITERKRRERELRQKNEQLDRFAGILSHDLRNPLAVAQGYLEAASERVECEFHDDIEIAHDRIESILGDVLLLARDGDVITDTEPIDFTRAVKQAWKNVDTADASLSVASDRSIVADEDRLLRLLENLFRNAIEHCGPAVHVRAETCAHGFFVEDDGPGIPDGDRQGIFEFGHTTSESGTGFGLAIVSQIVDGHGWSIQVTESEDRGTRFEFITSPSS